MFPVAHLKCNLKCTRDQKPQQTWPWMEMEFYFYFPRRLMSLASSTTRGCGRKCFQGFRPLPITSPLFGLFFPFYCYKYFQNLSIFTIHCDDECHQACISFSLSSLSHFSFCRHLLPLTSRLFTRFPVSPKFHSRTLSHGKRHT